MSELTLRLLQMDNVTNLSDVSITHPENCLDPLEEIMSFYEQAETDEPPLIIEPIDIEIESKNPITTKPKINFSLECQRLIESIENAQNKSDFYLSEILAFNDDD